MKNIIQRKDFLKKNRRVFDNLVSKYDFQKRVDDFAHENRISGKFIPVDANIEQRITHIAEFDNHYSINFSYDYINEQKPGDSCSIVFDAKINKGNNSLNISQLRFKKNKL